MPKTLEERAQQRALDAEVKRVVLAANCSVNEAATALGMKPKTLSRMLNTGRMREWWRKQRDAKKRANAKARRERWQDRRAKGLTATSYQYFQG